MLLLDKLFILIKYFFSKYEKKTIYCIANTKEQINETYKFRYWIYCKEQNYLPENKYPSGLEIDEYDNNGKAYNIIALDNKTNRIIGLLRLVPSENFSSLPSEKYYRIPLDDKKKSVELTRFIIDKEHRGSILIYFALIKSSIALARKIDTKIFFISVSTKRVKRYKLFGFRIVSQPYNYSSINHPYPSVTLSLNVDDAERNMLRINPAFGLFLKKNTSDIIKI